MRPVGTAPSRDSLAAAPVLVDVNGVRLAFPAYTIAPNVYLSADSRPEWPLRELPIDALGFQHWRSQERAHGQALFRQHVAQARAAGARLVIALVHWGGNTIWRQARTSAAPRTT
jgi:hypothetical protein